MSRLLNPSQAFMAHELREQGVTPGRIAEMLNVDEAVLRRSFRLPDLVEPEQVADEAPAESPSSWAPPADEHTHWRKVPVRGQELGIGVLRRMDARRVRLWGRDVWIDAQELVWCPSCLAFRTIEELSHPSNGCPVGVQWPSGTIWRLRDSDDESGRSRPIDLITRGGW